MKKNLMILTAALSATCCVFLSNAAAASPGRYLGKATPGGKVVAHVTATRHLRLKMNVRTACNTGGSLSATVTTNNPPKLRNGGRFSYSERGNGPHNASPYRYHVSGRVHNGRLRGTFDGVIVLAPSYPGGTGRICKGTAHFWAKRG